MWLRDVVFVSAVAMVLCASMQQHTTQAQTWNCPGKNAVDGASGSISDGPGVYSTNSECLWLIEADDLSHVVTLTFTSVETECGWDYVYVFDGPSLHSSEKLAALNGVYSDNLENPRLSTYVSTGPQMLVYLVSDQALVYDGFEADYITSECPLDCSSRGTCIAGECTCDIGYAGPYCERRDCPDGCSDNGNCVEGLCVCSDGWTGENCSTPYSGNMWRKHAGAELLSFDDRAALRRVGHSAVVVDRGDDGVEMIVFGGHSYVNESASLNDVWSYNVSAQTWSRVTTTGPQPLGVSGHSAGLIGRDMYIFSGEVADKVYANQTMALNVDTWEWRVVNAGGEHPVPRAWAASAVIGDCLYVHSGYSYASQAVFREMYAMCGEVWEHHPAISHDPKARMGHTMAAINGSQLVIFGGITREDEYLKDVWVYVPSERVYYPFKAQKYQSYARSMSPFTVVRDTFVGFGGRVQSSNCYGSAVVGLDVPCQAWRKYGPEAGPIGRYGHTAVTVGDSMLIFGGYAGVMLDDVWEYNVAENCSDTGATCDCTTSDFRCTKYTRCVQCSAMSDCGWCAFDQTCYAVDSAEADNCENNTILYEGASEWVDAPSGCDSCIQQSNHCEGCLALADQGCVLCDGECTNSSNSVCTGHEVTAGGICPVECDNRGECEDCVVGDGANECMWCGYGCYDASLTCLIDSYGEGDECFTPCEERTNCGDCSNAYPYLCMWCSATETCFDAVSQVMVHPWGQCNDWHYGNNNCPAPCSTYTDCDSCTEQVDCGWCRNSSTCMDGFFQGPRDAATCPAAEWDYMSCYCAQFDECGECSPDPECSWCASTGECISEEVGSQCPVLDEDFCPECGQYENCTACSASDYCGWCAESGSCLRGDAAGAALGSCSGTSWEYDSCANCELLSTCDSCTNSSLCGWCVDSDTCERGDVNGAYSGASACSATASSSSTSTTSGGSAWDYDACYHVCAPLTAGGCQACSLSSSCSWCCSDSDGAASCMPLDGTCPAGLRAPGDCPVCDTEAATCSECIGGDGVGGGDGCCEWHACGNVGADFCEYKGAVTNATEACPWVSSGSCCGDRDGCDACLVDGAGGECEWCAERSECHFDWEFCFSRHHVNCPVDCSALAGSCDDCIESGCIYCNENGGSCLADYELLLDPGLCDDAHEDSCPTICPEITDCAECIASETCGYCSKSDKCMFGDESGPSSGICSGGWSADDCGGYCDQYDGLCDDCMSDSACAFCPSGFSCLGATETSSCVGWELGDECPTIEDISDGNSRDGTLEVGEAAFYSTIVRVDGSTIYVTLEAIEGTLEVFASSTTSAPSQFDYVYRMSEGELNMGEDQGGLGLGEWFFGVHCVEASSETGLCIYIFTATLVDPSPSILPIVIAYSIALCCVISLLSLFIVFMVRRAIARGREVARNEIVVNRAAAAHRYRRAILPDILTVSVLAPAGPKRPPPSLAPLDSSDSASGGGGGGGGEKGSLSDGGGSDDGGDEARGLTNGASTSTSKRKKTKSSRGGKKKRSRKERGGSKEPLMGVPRLNISKGTPYFLSPTSGDPRAQAVVFVAIERPWDTSMGNYDHMVLATVVDGEDRLEDMPDDGEVPTGNGHNPVSLFDLSDSDSSGMDEINGAIVEMAVFGSGNAGQGGGRSAQSDSSQLSRESRESREHNGRHRLSSTSSSSGDGLVVTRVAGGVRGGRGGRGLEGDDDGESSVNASSVNLLVRQKSGGGGGGGGGGGAAVSSTANLTFDARSVDDSFTESD